MKQTDLEALRQMIRGEIENAAFFPPQWKAEQLVETLAAAVSKRLIDGTSDEVVPLLAELVVDYLPDALAIGLAKVLTDAVEKGVARGIREGLAPVAQEFKRLREAHEDQEQDDWWKKGPRSEDGEVPF